MKPLIEKAVVFSRGVFAAMMPRGLATKAQIDDAFLGIDKKTSRQILGISKEVSKKDAKKAYLRLMAEYHPDVNPHLDEEYLKRTTALSQHFNNALEAVESGKDVLEEYRVPRSIKTEAEYEKYELVQHAVRLRSNDYSLREISLNYAHKTSRAELEEFAHALVDNKSLAKLNIIWVCDDGTNKALIFDALSANQHLQSLDMQGFNADLPAAETAALSRMIRENKSLSHVDLNLLKVAKEDTDQLCAALQANTSLLYFKVSGDEKLTSVAEAVVKRNIARKFPSTSPQSSGAAAVDESEIEIGL